MEDLELVAISLEWRGMKESSPERIIDLAW